MLDIASLNYWLSLGAILMQIVSIILLAALLLRARLPLCADIVSQFRQNGLWLGAGVALAGTALALLYSDVLGFEPCPLCWWQRIFLFPQVFLLGIAAWKRDTSMATYSLVLTSFGGAVALYHHALQMLPGSGLPCPAQGVSCAQRLIFEFGYVTFPMMAVSVFAFLAIVMLIVRSPQTTETEPNIA